MKQTQVFYHCDECDTSQEARFLFGGQLGLPKGWSQVTVSRASVEGFSMNQGLTRSMLKHYCPECIKTGININVETELKDS